MFTKYKVGTEEVANRLSELQAGFAASGKPGTFEANALRVIGTRMHQHPERYVEFGPYWWAVKKALNAAGHDFGQAGDPLVAAEYRGASTVETLVAAEAFKDFYRATFIVGNSLFGLDDEGDDYELADADMQARVGAKS